MNAAQVVGVGRAFIESQMRSACVISRSGEPTTDPSTGVVTTPGVQVYTGPCRVRPASGPGGNSQSVQIAGVEAYTFDYLVSVPFAVSDVRERDRVTITASPDPALVGAEFEVRHIDRGEDVSARRLACGEVA